MPERFDIEKCLVYDADGQVLGRIASMIAKNLLDGKDVAVVNAEKAIISGKRKPMAAKYRTRLNLQEKENPEHSPYWSRRPDMLFKRIVRGMLPYRRPRGKEAFRKLRVFMGEPEALKSKEHIKPKIKGAKEIYAGYITLKDLSNTLGYNIDK
ncbi:50S ribosomal protein L13 [Candidatus Marsarchaeota archaeon]|jgi:large subunit ribosomal protein L13|nr:50S ribosomal protein L13 [Candidatus Marsarchaeota archaeon]